MVAEGDASNVLQATWHEKSQRLRTYSQTPGALVLYDTNLAREFVRDVKNRITTGKLAIFRCEEPYDIVDLGDTS